MRVIAFVLVAAAAGCIGDVDAPAGPGDLRINEVATRGEPHDWFEVINTGDRPIELSDFVFVDRQVDFLRAKRFPEITLEPGERYVQEVIRMEQGFQLGASEALFLYRHEDRVPIDRVAWKKGSAPHRGSYARFPDGTGRFGPSRRPTPGDENLAR
jgi:hypothetical protein